MSAIQDFMEILQGHFNNKEQFDQLTSQGVQGYPYAEHVISVCNSKINQLPPSFDGYFVLEESYYTINGKMRSEPRLFLFSPQDSSVILTSYELPQGVEKETLNYNSFPIVSYSELVKSEKFTPAVFTKKEDVWYGGSESMFSPSLKFILKEEFSQEKLVVSEVMESNGKKTFGFEPAIVYKRIHQ